MYAVVKDEEDSTQTIIGRFDSKEEAKMETGKLNANNEFPHDCDYFVAYIEEG